MESAFYGRMKYGRCVQRTFDDSGKVQQMGCAEDIIR